MVPRATPGHPGVLICMEQWECTQEQSLAWPAPRSPDTAPALTLSPTGPQAAHGVSRATSRSPTLPLDPSLRASGFLRPLAEHEVVTHVWAVVTGHSAPGPPQLGSWTRMSQNSAPGLPEAGVLTCVSQNSAPGLPAAGVLKHVPQNSAPGPPAAGVLTRVPQNSAPGPPTVGVLDTRVPEQCPRAPRSWGSDTRVPEQRPGPPTVPLEPALPSCRLQQTNSLVSAATALLQRVSRWKVKLKNQVFRDLTAATHSGHETRARERISSACRSRWTPRPRSLSYSTAPLPPPVQGRPSPAHVATELARPSPLLHP